ncbi:hypothetical protein ASPZODRAFT_133871 [Penicilliopsis zonata CBS 506.65]|uniref:Peptidase S33 tripeptidyl aminopeptidase-like C-terminal domain-containing protein n=1 Tax=Penicilliopsis zonata CBS 506.65 TaxID=1073090 RepID=A0A1L9SDM1_9EURO|nr:hypothetical protein ASPZODRAFT_133871 [Penicilliopsis zonata CBS 506.65]OJJ45238.1 hypothetical protein ASPZODRAFT_133871 [Penicilliopsis zonata CBS 506.65]
MQVLQDGKRIQKIVDTVNGDSQRFFDIVSFDPRGVGNTLPRMQCFPDSLTDYVWNQQLLTEGIVTSSRQAYDNLWARSKALSAACAKDDSGIASFMDTWSVANDMRAIARQLHGTEDNAHLQYWGFSYGTIIGSAFATHFPDEVDRMVLDGVVYGPAWHAGENAQFLRDADEVFERFFDYCLATDCEFAAGLEKLNDSLYCQSMGFLDRIKRFFEKCLDTGCSFDSPGHSDSEYLGYRLHDLLHRLRQDPLPVAGPNGPATVTYADVKRLISQSVYAPRDMFPILATILADLNKGNGSSLVEFQTAVLQETRPARCLMPECRADAVCTETCRMIDDYRSEVTSAVMCLDINRNHGLTGISKEEFRQQHVQPIMSASMWVGDTMTGIEVLLPCLHRDMPPVLPFDGPIGGKTATPILLIGNTLDPATPLASAHQTSQLFEGSVVLEQKSEGHCSYTAPSNCTEKHVRAYFNRGVLPKKGAKCEVDEELFPRSNKWLFGKKKEL